MEKLKVGDKIAIVSLSSGVAGENFVKHEIDLATKRLKEFGFIPLFMNNALKGMDFLEQHPESKAQDLLQAFLDKDVKLIFSAIGGNNAYEICPYIFENQELISAIKNNPKIFVGFSDTTTNHLIFYKLGLKTFYGQSLLVDIAELDKDMLPYSKQSFINLFDGFVNKEIISSDVWYEERNDFSPSALNTPRVSHKENKGYISINGNNQIISGTLFGGCLDVLYTFVGGNQKATNFNNTYQIFPTNKDFYKDKILFLETSDNKPSPSEFEKMIKTLNSFGILSSAKAILFGKPQDEMYFEDYMEILKQNTNTPILFNLNFGHALPHTILPYGEKATIDFCKKSVIINS